MSKSLELCHGSRIDESIESIHAIVQDLWSVLEIPGRPYKLNVPKQVLMFLMWLKTYPAEYMLALLSDISECIVSRQISAIVPVFWVYTHRIIKWPTRNECRGLVNTFDMFPNCVSMIDGTVHEMEQPRDDEAQCMVYDGHPPLPLPVNTGCVQCQEEQSLCA